MDLVGIPYIQIQISEEKTFDSPHAKNLIREHGPAKLLLPPARPGEEGKLRLLLSLLPQVLSLHVQYCPPSVWT